MIGLLCASIFEVQICNIAVHVFYTIYSDYQTNFNFRIHNHVYAYSFTPMAFQGFVDEKIERIVMTIQHILETVSWILENHGTNAVNFASSFRKTDIAYQNFLMHHVTVLLMMF